MTLAPALLLLLTVNAPAQDDLSSAGKKALDLAAKPKVLSVVVSRRDGDSDCLTLTRRARTDAAAARPGTPENPIAYVLTWRLRENGEDGRAVGRTQEVTLFSLSAPDGKPREPSASAFRFGLGCSLGALKWATAETAERSGPARGAVIVRAYGPGPEGSSAAQVDERQCAGAPVYWGMSGEDAERLCRDASGGGP